MAVHYNPYVVFLFDHYSSLFNPTFWIKETDAKKNYIDSQKLLRFCHTKYRLQRLTFNENVYS